LGFPGYIEKIEYWAVIWGTAIMAGTGMLLWFENLTMRLLPLWVLNLCTAVHFYEAVLATLAILVWHIYFVMLDPTVYPLKSAKRLRSDNQ
jgi:cytochrome b subunit of formate dehydrogenase